MRIILKSDQIGPHPFFTNEKATQICYTCEIGPKEIFDTLKNKICYQLNLESSRSKNNLSAMKVDGIG